MNKITNTFKKIFFIFPIFCIGCSSMHLISKSEAIKYAKQHYVSKEELTPKTLIEFKTISYSNEEAKTQIEALAHFGYNIDLDASLNGNKSLLTKEEFIEFYSKPFLPLDEETINAFPKEPTFQLKGDEMEIKTLEINEGERDEKVFAYLANGYEKIRIESFNHTKQNYSFKVEVTSTYTYQ